MLEFCGEMKKIIKILGYLGIFLLIIVGTLVVKAFIELQSNKLLLLKSDLGTYYYNMEKLENLMKEKLGDDYLGDWDKDFDHYVISLVMEQLQSVEHKKFSRYNAFLSKEKVEKIVGDMEKAAGEVTGKELTPDTFYLQLSGFYDGITLEKVKDHHASMSNHPNIIIDLRNNTGGSIDETEKVAQLFLEKGQTIYQIAYSERTKIVTSGNDQPLKYQNMVLLTNDQTASSAELFVLALRENLPHAVVIGTRTYGKPVSYAFRKYSDGAGMIFINGIMKGPNGAEIRVDGIEPDISVGNTEAQYAEISDPDLREQQRKTDERLQLETALEYLASNEGSSD